MCACTWNGKPAFCPARLTIQLKLSVVNGPRRSLTNTNGESYTPRRPALLWGLPGRDPFADARVRNAFASVKRGERPRDAGDLPLGGVEVGGNRFGGEERSAATSALGELFKAALGRATYAN